MQIDYNIIKRRLEIAFTSALLLDRPTYGTIFDSAFNLRDIFLQISSICTEFHLTVKINTKLLFRLRTCNVNIFNFEYSLLACLAVCAVYRSEASFDY